MVTGVLLLLTGVVSYPIVLPLTKEAEKQLSTTLPSVRPLFKSTAFLASLLITTTAAVTFGFTESLLELHLETFDLSVTQIGLCFLGYALAYTLFTILAGLVTDVHLAPWTVNAGGLVVTAAGYYILGPQPFFPLSSSITITMVSLVLQGVGNAGILVSSYSCTLAAALAMPQYEDDVSTYSLISSLWTASYALGNFLGPTLAGVLYDQVMLLLLQFRIPEMLQK